MMATLNLPRFTMGLPIWLFSTRVSLNAPNASYVSTLCQDDQIKVNPLLSSPIKYSPPSSSLSGESVDTSNQQSKKKKRKCRKNKRVQGGMNLTIVIQARNMKPTTMSHDGKK